MGGRRKRSLERSGRPGSFDCKQAAPRRQQLSEGQVGGQQEGQEVGSKKDKKLGGSTRDGSSVHSSSGAPLDEMEGSGAEDEEQDSSATKGAYLALKVQGMFGRDPWKRRYFVLRGSLVYYYKDKRAFQLEPSKPINQRAIDLEGYQLLADCQAPPFLLSLLPVEEDDIRKVWRFRTDTQAEYVSWTQLFAQALALTEAGCRLGSGIVVTQSEPGAGGAAGRAYYEDEDEEELE
ncbi:hypothetical protein EON65_09760 [archaeon]|nr:MAG: hypothetical protein EON65_09760 [archaeon]